ncbi:meromycolate extension acyl carrier protein AcpM [Rhodococcus sovatensis]|uniref:Acyl carrier protein n=1 Tax=Rhodococcus sovatensis TaxID=1805840 RepID=A0ABZ2PH61_9NOCA
MAIAEEQVIAGIAEIIEEVTGIDAAEVTLEKSFVDDLDIDSLSMVEIAVQLEDKYGVSIPDEEVSNLKSVGDAVDYVQRMELDNAELAVELKTKYDGSADK